MSITNKAYITSQPAKEIIRYGCFVEYWYNRTKWVPRANLLVLFRGNTNAEAVVYFEYTKPNFSYLIYSIDG